MEQAADAFFNMVFRDGVFHADMHPGNLFVGKNGQLIAVDFGITGRVDLETRYFLAEMLIGFLNGDYRKVAEIHFKAGYVPAYKSVDAFSQAIRSVAQPILGRPLHEISVARLLGQLFEITETFAMETQPQLLLLQKSMLVAEGLGRRLDPTINMWGLARPLIEGWMGSHLGVRARVTQSVRGWAQSLERLPRLIDFAEHAALSMQSGGLKLHPDTVKAMTGRDRAGPGFIRTWLPWGLVAGLSIALALR
jgi:ubiquinone biosynthesis protein